ncbi:MAG TPA: MarR family transcriptional regulator [Acidimicrobiales bacterium]|nr:MarR family transcriptional regulator [Acidimicrobiales bacterium]
MSPAAPPDADATPALVDDPRLTAVGLLFEAATGLGDLLAGQIGEHGLAPSEFEALLRLVRSPGGQLRMSDLATQANLSSSGLTRLVDRLQARGLVERRACPTDGRGAFAVATPAGTDLLLGVLPGHVAVIEAWYTSRLAPPDLATLSGALRTIRDAVRPGAEAGAHAPPAG